MKLSFEEIEKLRLDFPLEVVKKYWDYNPETGEFFNKRLKRILNPNISGRYLQISIPYRGHKFRFYAQRLAVLFMTGKMPPENMDVDHINYNKKDNCWRNLRVVTRSENNMNRPFCNQKSTTGVKYCSFHKASGKYQVIKPIDGKQKFIGLFDSPSAADLFLNKTSLSHDELKQKLLENPKIKEEYDRLLAEDDDYWVKRALEAKLEWK